MLRIPQFRDFPIAEQPDATDFREKFRSLGAALLAELEYTEEWCWNKSPQREERIRRLTKLVEGFRSILLEHEDDQSVRNRVLKLVKPWNVYRMRKNMSAECRAAINAVHNLQEYFSEQVLIATYVKEPPEPDQTKIQKIRNLTVILLTRMRIL